MSLAKWVPAHFSHTSTVLLPLGRKTCLRFGKRYVKAAGLLLIQIKTPPEGGVFICITASRPSVVLVFVVRQ